MAEQKHSISLPKLDKCKHIADEGLIQFGNHSYWDRHWHCTNLLLYQDYKCPVEDLGALYCMHQIPIHIIEDYISNNRPFIKPNIYLAGSNLSLCLYLYDYNDILLQFNCSVSEVLKIAEKYKHLTNNQNRNIRRLIHLLED